MIAAGLEVPEIFSGLRVEREDVPVARRHEQDVAAGRENAVGQRSLKERIRPHGLAGFRVERLDAGVRCRLIRAARRRRTRGAAAPEILLTTRDLLRCARVNLSAFTECEIEPARQRTVGRRLEIRPSAERRIHEDAALRARVRAREWAAVCRWRRIRRSSSDR